MLYSCCLQCKKGIKGIGERMKISLKVVVIIDVIFVLQFIVFALPICNKPVACVTTFDLKEFGFMLVQLFVSINLVLKTACELYYTLTHDRVKMTK